MCRKRWARHASAWVLPDAMTVNSRNDICHTRSLHADPNHPAGRPGRGRPGRYLHFNAHKDFRRACDTLLNEPAVRALELDLARVQYLDSSALGMLLILRDKAEERGKRVILSGARGTVRQVLEIANFAKLFTLRD